MIVQSGHGIEQGCQQIGSGIANLGAVVRDPLHDTLNVHGGDLGEPFLHIGGRIFCVPANADGGTAVHCNLQHDFHQLVYWLRPKLFPQPIILNLMKPSVVDIKITGQAGACPVGWDIQFYRLLSCWRLRIQASNSLKMVSWIFSGE